MRTDLTSKTFGRLTVIKYAGYARDGRDRVSAWACRCACGNDIVAKGKLLRDGRVRSCGCLLREARQRTVKIALQAFVARSCQRARNASGRVLEPPGYRSWWHMVQRCTRPKHKDYPYYGGRGITVCERWRTFANFVADMGARPSGMSIDRIDNSKGYEPGNCRWATRSMQMRNMRGNRLVTVAGRTQPLIAWSEETGVRAETIGNRLARGWSPERAVSEPTRRRDA